METKKFGCENLNISEKLLVLNYRYKNAGADLAATVGTTKITLSRWINHGTNKVRMELREALVKASEGWIKLEDFEKPGKKRKVEEPKKEMSVDDLIDDLDL